MPTFGHFKLSKHESILPDGQKKPLMCKNVIHYSQGSSIYEMWMVGYQFISSRVSNHYVDPQVQGYFSLFSGWVAKKFEQILMIH